MKTITKPFRAEHIGSFLRPTKLANARRLFLDNKITKSDLTLIEDECIKELVIQELNHGIKGVTDGEFRRSFWHLDFLENLNGISRVNKKAWSIEFKEHQPKALSIEIKDKIDFNLDHPFIDALCRLQNIAYNLDQDCIVKYTIPSPTMLHLIAAVREENYKPIDIYKDEDALFTDIANTYIKAINSLYDKGLRYLQFDDTSWGEFCSQEKIKEYTSRGINLNKLEDRYIELINEVLKHKKDDLFVSMHICRGNFRSTYFSSGSYDAIASKLFNQCDVNAFFLEYDTDRAGGFEPLSYVKEGKYVVLGLLSSKFDELEDESTIIDKIQKASQYIPLENLCLSAQCGFASTEEGNLINTDTQFKKLDLISKIAKKIWIDA